MGIEINKRSLDYLIKYVCELVSAESGNVLESAQRSMVESRIKKRIIDLRLNDHREYLSFLEENLKTESKELVSLLTTHHTFFFREFYHFEYMINNFQRIINTARERGDSKIRIYSAACSRGQEAYSLAMFMNVMLKKMESSLDFEVVGTDIDEHCVKHAQRGIYDYIEIKKIPEEFLKGHFEKGKGEFANYVRVKSHIKEKVQFYPANIFDENHIKGKFDIIFCRNVFIYFKQDQIYRVVDIFKQHLYPKAFFVTGLSESLKSLKLKELFYPGICTYSFFDLSSKEIEIDKSDVIASFPLIPKPIRLGIVDDSKSIQKLLTKIFKEDPAFEVVAIANDGLEAEEMLKNNEIDAMTLDIHMPNKNGVEYLRDNFNSHHPKVIIVSSASREDLDFSVKAIEFGASDFVEKPALNNIGQRSEELKNKIKMSFLSSKSQIATVHKSFAKEFRVQDLTNCLRVLIGSNTSLSKFKSFIDEMKAEEPPCLLLLDGNKNILESTALDLSKKSNKKVEILNRNLDPVSFQPNTIYVSDAEDFLKFPPKEMRSLKKSLCIFGLLPQYLKTELTKLSPEQVLLEDFGEDFSGSQDRFDADIDDIFPYTSFYYISSRFLSGS